MKVKSVLLLLMLGCAFAKPIAAKKKAATDCVHRVDEAKKLLASAKIGSTRVRGDDAVLAVCKPGEKKLRLVHVLGGIVRTKGFKLKLHHRNGVNSLYEVLEPEGCVVLAIRTNVTRWKRGKRRGSMPVVYVPYGEHFDRDEFVEAGRQYLIDVADQAAARLEKRGVRSLIDPDALVTETVSEKILITLLVIEHIDPRDFETRGAEKMMRKVLVTIGLNRGDAYDYAVSDKQAGGLAQFIPETYARIRRDYPDAKLIDGFIAGMRDHVNAVMAQYGLNDWSLSQLTEDERAELAKDDEELGAWLAAAYNSGAHRAVPAYRNDRQRWDQKGKGLPGDTPVYVQEFRAVYRLLFPPPD